MSDSFTLEDYEKLSFPLNHKVQKHWLWGKFGFIHINNLDKLPNIYKRLDELRETVEDIGEKTDLFQKCPTYYWAMMRLDELHQTLIWKCFGINGRVQENIPYRFHVRNISNKKYEQYFFAPYYPKKLFARFLYKRYLHIHKSQIFSFTQLMILDVMLKMLVDSIIEGNYFKKEFWVFAHLKNIEEYLAWINRLVTDG